MRCTRTDALQLRSIQATLFDQGEPLYPSRQVEVLHAGLYRDGTLTLTTTHGVCSGEIAFSDADRRALVAHLRAGGPGWLRLTSASEPRIELTAGWIRRRIFLGLAPPGADAVAAGLLIRGSESTRLLNRLEDGLH